MNLTKLAVATAAFSQPLKQSLRTAARLDVEGVVLDARAELRPTDLTESGQRQFLGDDPDMGRRHGE